uniref:Uncharacterized protein n=1 Tax=Trieres chinensis TaxID=1514140 RepID=A0A7S1Z138_TRICV|mmetsp:Transcript_15017/g.30690  ORF Transcript_15017/g.30690 Transcript_15017/m.30690 type:complete len:100 (+) Transcript_15017:197-496(+)
MGLPTTSIDEISSRTGRASEPAACSNTPPQPTQESPEAADFRGGQDARRWEDETGNSRRRGISGKGRNERSTWENMTKPRKREKHFLFAESIEDLLGHL